MSERGLLRREHDLMSRPAVGGGEYYTVKYIIFRNGGGYVCSMGGPDGPSGVCRSPINAVRFNTEDEAWGAIASFEESLGPGYKGQHTVHLLFTHCLAKAFETETRSKK